MVNSMGKKKIRKLIFNENDIIDMQNGTYLKIEFNEERNEFQINHYTNNHNLISVNNLINIEEE